MRFIVLALLATLIGAAGGSWAFGGHALPYRQLPQIDADGHSRG